MVGRPVVDPLEAAAVLTGACAVYALARQRIAGWPLTIVSAMLFAMLFWRVGLYALASLQGLYLALALYGWRAWRFGGADGRLRPVSRVPRRAILALAVAGVAIAALAGALLARRTSAPYPIVDAGAATFSAVAQFMQARKWIENWPVWIAVDLVYAATSLAVGLPLTALLYLGFTALAVWGWRQWTRALSAL